jgi:hypothetical protein
LYHLTDPPVDTHQWRETQTLMIAKNFYSQSMNIFLPRVNYRAVFEDKNDDGYVGVTELNVVPFLTALLYHLFGTAPWVDRIVPIVFSLVGLFYFHRLAASIFNLRAALAGTFLLSFSPMYWFLGRVHLPESFSMCMTIMALYYFDRWLESDGKRNTVSAMASVTVMLLSKPQTAYVAIPMLFLAVMRHRCRLIVLPRMYLFVVVALLPPVIYYVWSFYVMPSRSGLLFTGTGTDMLAYGLLKKPEFYAKILGSTWLYGIGSALTCLAAAGLVTVFAERPAGSRARCWLPHVLFLGAVYAVIAMPSLHADNRYYQSIFAIPAALLAGQFLSVLMARRFLNLLAVGLAIFAAVSSVHAANMFDSPDYTRSNYESGNWVREHTKSTDRAIVATDDPSALYFAERTGWTLRYQADNRSVLLTREMIESVAKRGATTLVFPDSRLLDGYPGQARFAELRDSLYDSFYCHRGNGYVVFQLFRTPDLELPPNGCLTPEDFQVYKYLRGAWGIRLTDTYTGKAFIHKSGKSGSIVFVPMRQIKEVLLDVSADENGSNIEITANGQPCGKYPLGPAWKCGRLHIPWPEDSQEDQRQTLTLNATNAAGKSVNTAFYGMSVYY